MTENVVLLAPISWHFQPIIGVWEYSSKSSQNDNKVLNHPKLSLNLI